MSNILLQDLLKKYLDERLTPEEFAQLYELIQAGYDPEALNELLAETLTNPSYAISAKDYDKKEVFASLLAKIEERETTNTFPASVVPFYRSRLLRWTAAAVAVLLISSVVYLINNRTNEKPAIATVNYTYKGDVLPGHNGAVLHLSNGQTIILDSVQNGTVARQGSVEVVKVNGELKYVGKADEVIYNDITTDRGRQWQVTLPDGSRVWLNAASSIHYPLTFTGPVREVEITGEAYFEVIHNSKQPFRVKVGGQVIQDIGTAFNINAYSDEPVAKTTVVEGAVQVSKGTSNVLVKPGHQAIDAGNGLVVSPADVDQSTAWRRGIFSYHRTGIAELMRQLARWYNVEVKYEGTVPADKTFTGDIGRNLTLVQVLHGLKGMNVNFKIEEDKRIVIMP